MKAMKASAWLSALALSAGLCSAVFAADDKAITGTAKLDGKAPKRAALEGVAAVKACAEQHPDPLLDESVVADENGNLANVVVFLTGPNLKGTAPAEAAVLDQKGCQYVPHVLAMMVGQKLVAKNDDGFLHNVHTLPEANEPDNKAQPTKQEDTLKPVKAAERFKVKCDVHPWMSAWVYAFDHPFFAVTGDDGAYSIDTKGLADGTYEIHAWQEKYKEAPVGKVTVKGGKGEANFTFKAKAAAAGPAGPGAQTAYVVATPAEKGEACPACAAAAKAAVTAK